MSPIDLPITKTSASGTFILESSEIRSAHLLLQSNYRKPAIKGPSTPSPHLVRIPNDPLALNVQISQSNRSAFQKKISMVHLIPSLQFNLGSHNLSWLLYLLGEITLINLRFDWSRHL